MLLSPFGFRPGSLTEPRLGFEGDGNSKRRKDKAPKTLEAMAEARLIADGKTRDVLWRQWGVILWSLRAKKQELRLKVDATHNPKLDWKALEAWFYETLAPLGELHLKEKPLKSCCEKGCKGCLNGNSHQRRTWIPSKP